MMTEGVVIEKNGYSCFCNAQWDPRTKLWMASVRFELSADKEKAVVPGSSHVLEKKYGSEREALEAAAQYATDHAPGGPGL